MNTHADEQEIERRAQDRLAQLIDGIPVMLERSVERGLRKAIDDPELQARFWERGYAELERHAGTNAMQWLGRRIWNMVITAAVAAALAWAVVSGKAK